jgi:dipeptidase E
MILFLTSSPCVIGAERAILNEANGFVDRLREALPANPKCLFISSDPDSYGLNDGFGLDMSVAFAEAGMEFSGYAVLDGRNAVFAQPLIWASDLIILCGGHVPTMNDFLLDLELPELLEDYQGVVMGISAGSMNCAARVYAQPEEPGESSPAFPRFLSGLGLTDTNILPHYQQVKDNILDEKRLYEDITFADSIGECFLVLPDGSYIYSDSEEELLCGEGYLLADGQMRQISKEGDEIIL